MKTYKTKNKKEFNYSGKPVQKTIFVEVKFPLIGQQIIRPQGRFYFINDDKKEVNLLKFDYVMTWDEITKLENDMLFDFKNQRNTLEVLNQRIYEWFFAYLDIENQKDPSSNYGIKSSELINIK